MRIPRLLPAVASLSILLPAAPALEPLHFNHPGLVVDLGVGLWAQPLPMDFDGDGDLDLVVSCPDKPSNGVYVFENATGDTAKDKFPVFKPARRISKAMQNVRVSYGDGKPLVLTPAAEYPDFLQTGLDQPRKLPLPANVHPNKVRGNFWSRVDFDGDGKLDVIVGADDWTDYGWDNAYDAAGKWTNGPLRGFVYFIRNTGDSFAPPVKLMVGDQALETFGWPCPNFADWDGDGDLDLICGEFLDGFTYFENIGTRTAPQYAPGRRAKTADGQPLAMDLEMIVPMAIDWDKDGDVDLVVGDEDGRVALIENTGKLSADRTPLFLAPHYFQQEADQVKFGALCTPVGVDWDGDGDTDIISGNTAGYIGFIENLSGPRVETPKWAAPKYLEADGQRLRILAGPNGSIQGPAEAKWGYTTQSVADWDGDGLPDLLVNSILGKVTWYRNVGTRTAPRLAAAQPIEVEWNGAQPALAYGWLRPEGKALLTQWRTTPVGVDWNKDGLTDLVMLDQEGYLAFFERSKRDGKLVLLAPRRVFVGDELLPTDPPTKFVQTSAGAPLWMNKGIAGKSGRRKLCVVDWDGDGQLDFLVNAANAAFLRQTGAHDGQWFFKDLGLLSDRNIEGHDVSPAVVDFNGDGVPDFLGGAEDGHFYYLKNPRSGGAVPPTAVLKSELIYETAPFPSCHATTIVEAKGGIIASWFGGTAEGKPDVGIWVARIEDGKWTTPEEVATGAQPDGTRHPCWNPVLFQPTRGPLLLFYKVGPSPSAWWGMLRTSTDGGRTWSDARRLPEGILGPIKNKPVQLADGTIICPTSTETGGKPNDWRVHFELTKDLGKTWSTATPPATGTAELNAIQPSILVHSATRLQAIGRTREKQLFETWSEDAGRTWSALTPTTLPNPNSGTDAVTLRDGRHLLIYNHTPKGRSPLNLAISMDGKLWQAALVLEDEPKAEFSYPAIIQTSDGLVHITYTWKRQKVRHVVIDPAKLKAQPLAAVPAENSIGMKLVRIEPGSFLMGQDGPAADYNVKLHAAKFDDADWDERPAHRVKISTAFSIGATEVTLAQYRQFQPKHAGGRGADDDAVTGVSWEDAVKFCAWLSAKEKRTYRLPTEGEWEYACRAGTTTLFHTGDRLPDGFHQWNANIGLRDRFFPDGKLPPEIRAVTAKATVRVGQTPANAWGLFDLHGNVAEWCADWYGPYEAGEQTDPLGRADGDFRVIRGGSHSIQTRLLRSANRAAWLPETSSERTGFRVVLGDLPRGQTLPKAAPALHAQNVDPAPVKIAPAASDAPFFSGPRPFVKIPPNSFGPLFSGHNHSPGIAECPNGDLLAVWYSCVDEAGTELNNLASRLRRGATEWEPASLFWDGADVNDHGPKLWWDGDRTLFHFARGAEENIVRTSTDSGATWSKARVTQPVSEFSNAPIKTREGFIVIMQDTANASLNLSRDGGQTWTFPPIAEKANAHRNGSGFRHIGIHSPVVQLADGRLMAYSRLDDAKQQEKFGFLTPVNYSSDWGATWTYDIAPFPAISSVQRQVLMRLREGPLLCCSYTDQSRDWKVRKGLPFKNAAGAEFTGYGLFAALSFDDGKTWPVRRLITPGGQDRTVSGIDRGQFVLSDTMAEPQGYLAATQTRDGNVQLISSKNHYVFNLAWLQQSPPAR